MIKPGNQCNRQRHGVEAGNHIKLHGVLRKALRVGRNINKTIMETSNILTSENREKFTTHLFIANAVILLLFIFFWGFGQMGFVSQGGLFSGITLVKTYYNVNIAGDTKILAIWLLLIPVSSGYMLYCALTGTKRFIKLARILLILGFIPVLTLVLISSFNALGLILSLLLAVSLFFSKRMQTLWNKLFQNA